MLVKLASESVCHGCGVRTGAAKVGRQCENFGKATTDLNIGSGTLPMKITSRSPEQTRWA